MLLAWLCQASTIEEEVEKLQWSALWGACGMDSLDSQSLQYPSLAALFPCLLSHPLNQV